MPGEFSEKKGSCVFNLKHLFSFLHDHTGKTEEGRVFFPEKRDAIPFSRGNSRTMWEPSPTFPQNRQERPPHALFQNTAGMESKPPKNKGPAQTPEGEALAEELSRHGWLRTWQTSSFRFPLPFCNWDVPCRNLRAPLCRMRTFQAFVCTPGRTRGLFSLKTEKTLENQRFPGFWHGLDRWG